ncbi:MAG: FAD-dependent pyridine nucleotide-disulfide oxidoreductase [Rariglobus sp.]|nr:FAD-dependent pyridine nucleotide-disulfide oxidoreductase [Rariglobus sp.]
MHDVIIIGAGPAGLSAALLLARCRRTVFLFDSNKPRNGLSQGLHGYLTRDGVGPFELRALGRADLARYPCMTLHEDTVTDVRRAAGMFEVTAESGRKERSRLLLLATGRVDSVPDRPGFQEYFGRGVYHCPYCDGWEHRGQPLAVYGGGRRVIGFARDLLTWSDQVTICCDGPPEWTGGESRAAGLGIRVITRRLLRLEGGAEGLTHIRFETGDPLPCGALFFNGECPQRSSLPERLGCQFDQDSSVLCNQHAAANVPGLYIAGNVRGGRHLAITAAAEGAEAAVAINEVLLDRAYPSSSA